MEELGDNGILLLIQNTTNYLLRYDNNYHDIYY